MLAPRIEAARFLDLCAGTGAVGIEALSRGAAHVTFVDQSRKMCGLIDSNLETLEISTANFVVIPAEATEYLRRQAKKHDTQFDIVYFDPPYAIDYDLSLGFIGEGAAQMLGVDAVVVVEHHKKTVLADQFRDLHRYRELKQGDSVLSFYRAL